MKVIKKIINESEMTRSKEARKKTTKILLCPFYNKEMIKYIESLKYQDEMYLSFHYLIDYKGRILNIIPDKEVAYPTSCIDLDLECISIGIYIKGKKEKLVAKQIKSIKYLVKYICNKYNLTKNDVIISYNVFNTREFEYYIDNYFEFIDLIYNDFNVK